MYKQLYSSLCKINLVSIASKKLKMIIEDCFSDQSIVYPWVCHFLKNLISFFSKVLNHTIISLTLCKDKVTCEPITYPFLVIKIILHLFFLCIGELKISLYIYMKVKGKKVQNWINAIIKTPSSHIDSEMLYSMFKLISLTLSLQTLSNFHHHAWNMLKESILKSIDMMVL